MTRSRGLESEGRRRRFSEEFKAEAVGLLRARRAAGVSVAQIGRELGVRPDQLRKWAKRQEEQAGGRGLDAHLGPERGLNAEEELRRLRRENAILRQERDFARKAAAFFARASR